MDTENFNFIYIILTLVTTIIAVVSVATAIMSYKESIKVRKVSKKPILSPNLIIKDERIYLSLYNSGESSILNLKINSENDLIKQMERTNIECLPLKNKVLLPITSIAVINNVSISKELKLNIEYFDEFGEKTELKNLVYYLDKSFLLSYSDLMH